MFSKKKDFYEKLSGKELFDQEVFEARDNFVGFFDLRIWICIKKSTVIPQKQKLFSGLFVIFTFLAVDYRVVWHNILWIKDFTLSIFR